MAAPSSHGQLTYADRARKAQAIRSPIQVQQPAGPPSPSKKSPNSDQKPHKSAAVNVWDRRKEELAARSQPREIIPNGPSEDDDDDPFVVRSSRARPHVPVTTEGLEDWPEVGKSIQPPTTDEPRPANGGQNPKKGAPKWIPLQLQSPVEVQSQHRKEANHNRRSANASRPPSNHGQSRSSRNQSARNSASHSRIHSTEGSVHSSPRNPRNRRLPPDDPPPASKPISNTPRSSRTGSPSHVQVPSDIPTYNTYLSPQQGSSPYYSQPLVNPVVYHSPSHASHPNLPPTDTPLPPMLPQSVHGYTYPYQYISYDCITASAPYSYWNGHQGSHPGSGTHSPVYPPSAMLYPVLPMYVQQHLQSPPMQPQSSTYSYSSSKNASSKVASASNSPGTTTSNVAMPSQSSARINGLTSVVFGSIESPSLSPEMTFSPSTSSVVDDSITERMSKTLAIGVDSSAVPKSRKSANKPVKEKEVVDGEITVDPAIVKEAEAGSSGDVKWKFGNEGLVHDSPARCTATDLPSALTNVESSGHQYSPPIVDEGVGYDFGIAAGKTMPVDVPTDQVEVDAPIGHPSSSSENDIPATTTLASEYPSQPGPSNGRPRRGSYYKGYSGYDRGGYTGERRRGRGGGGLNGYNGRGGYHNRGYAGRGSGNHNHHHNSYSHQNSVYQLRHQVPPSTAHGTPFNAASPTFQGLLPSHNSQPSHVDYYPSPILHRGGHGGMATYIPIGYEPYPPPPPPPPLSLRRASSSSAQTPLQLSQSSSAGHAGHGHTAPPMPMPMSQIGFPLDSTRYYLLGQLEYYLSPQNMAQDLFLRRRMDSKGWIEIDLLASFNRVKQLTSDYRLVREVLMLSTLVQVREGYVRMGGWERFVLPDAVKSVVQVYDGDNLEDLQLQQRQEYLTSSSYDFQSPSSVGESGNMMGSGDIISSSPSQNPQQWENQYSGGSGGSGEEEVEYVEEEEEEDDVVFVMGQNGGEEMWSHEKRAVR